MIIAQGAEAIITLIDNKIIKNRQTKKYRHPTIDKQLRRTRTKHEAKILQKLELINYNSPRLIEQKESTITMTYLRGRKMREIFDENPQIYARQIGKLIGKLHSHGIIHGDLTTSNMIINKELFLIDFGLSTFSDKIEDKAVDLHLLDRALESKHWKTYETAKNEIIEGYKEEYSEHQKVLQQLKKVQTRGRNK